MQAAIKKAAELRKAGKFEDAFAALNVVLQTDPQNPDIHYQMAWTCDASGDERRAVGYYEAALTNGLKDDRKGAYLGLGSTYRCLGEYQKSAEVFQRALAEYPDDRALSVFQSLTLYNLGDSKAAVTSLLRQLIETTSSEDIKAYERALAFYAQDIDKSWP